MLTLWCAVCSRAVVKETVINCEVCEEPMTEAGWFEVAPGTPPLPPTHRGYPPLPPLGGGKQEENNNKKRCSTRK